MQGDVWAIVWTTAVSIVAVAALAAVTGGWIARSGHPAAAAALRAGRRSCCSTCSRSPIGVGLAFLAAAVAANLITRSRSARPVEEQS